MTLGCLFCCVNEPKWIGLSTRSLPTFLGGRFGFHTKIDYRKKGNLILTSLLEDLVNPGSTLRNRRLDFNGFRWGGPQVAHPKANQLVRSDLICKLITCKFKRIPNSGGSPKEVSSKTNGLLGSV